MKLQEIREMLENISRWPWNIKYDNDTGPNDNSFNSWYECGPAIVEIHSYLESNDKKRAELDASFIAKSPEIISQLLNENEIMGKALNDIITHQEMIAGQECLKFSTTAQIAIRALKECETEDLDQGSLA